MLDRLRFQEIEKAIFKVKIAGRYGNRYLLENEPFMIIDNAAMSNFKVGERSKTSTGRSVESDTSTIKSVSFDLSNGQVMLNLFNSIFGDTVISNDEHILTSSFTINNTVQMDNEEVLELPTEPLGEVMLYITDDYGNLTKIREDQYTISGKEITFIKPISHLITYVYEQLIPSQSKSTIKQLGEHLILKLELQCAALDTLTEERVNVLMKFDRVSVGTNFSISFNNSERASSSTIYIEALPEENSGINKPIFTIEMV